MNIINRPDYTDKVLRLFGKGLIIALTGQRRVGKSFIMKQVINQLSVDDNNNIIYVDKEDELFHSISTHTELTQYVKEHLIADKTNYLFIDEVQNIKEFELTLRSLHSQEACEIVITGSNAKMLSSELSTYLSGRCMEYYIQSLDYTEFLKFHQLPDNDQSLISYLTYGGMPQLYRIGLQEEDLVNDYLQNVYNTIILKDIVEREDIRNAPLLKNLVRFVSDNVGKPFSATNIVNYLKSQRVDSSTKVIINYLDYLCNAFIIHRVSRYDIHGKRLFEVNDKYYFEDIGIRNSLVQGGLAQSMEKVIENAIYLHLTRLGYNVTVGYLQKAEIDFVATKGEQTIYVQATYLLANEETVTREFGNLALIKDNFPKYVVSMDSLYSGTNFQGIHHMHLRDFLRWKP
jgi:Predicted ATPase (AAA+ superfamily)